MARKSIVSTDLSWLFVEKLKAFSDCPHGIKIAIVPTKSHASGWIAVTNPQDRVRRPLCTRRIEDIQKRLREIYVLAKD
jgi:hypothetical protein